jgi:ABC-2 type transport system permease protein
VLTVAEITIRHQFNDSFIVFAILVQPVIIAVLAMFMLKDTAANAAMFVVVGSGLTGLWSSLLFVSGNSINTERWEGTLESLVGGRRAHALRCDRLRQEPGQRGPVAAFDGRGLPAGGAVLWVRPAPGPAPAVLPYVVPERVRFYQLWPDHRPTLLQQWQNAMEYPVYILGGFLFPILLLPGWTTPISYILPPYWAAVALHGTSTAGAPLQQTLFAWVMMAVLSAIYLFIASRLFRIMLYKARVDATLDVQ